MKFHSAVWWVKEDNDLHRQTDRQKDRQTDIFFVGFRFNEAQKGKKQILHQSE